MTLWRAVCGGGPQGCGDSCVPGVGAGGDGGSIGGIEDECPGVRYRWGGGGLPVAVDRIYPMAQQLAFLYCRA